MSDILDYFEEGWPAIMGVPDEWLPTIYDLHELIKRYIDSGMLENYKIQQIKQKFGALCFYYTIEPVGANGMYYSNVVRGAVTMTEFICRDRNE